MTSGIPFSPQEIAYVKAHSPKEFPSIIARGLAVRFREYNGGYRSRDAVVELMKKIHNPQQPDTAPPEPKKAAPDLRKGSTKKRKRATPE